MNEKVMPKTVKEIFDKLWEEVTEIRVRTKILEQLYGNQESISLLERFGGSVFELFYEILLGDIVLRLSKISDHSTTGKYENASMSRLVECVEAEEAGLAAKLGIDARCIELREKTGGLRVLRNRVIAHLDWGRRADPLPTTSRLEIEAVIETAQQVLRTVSLHFADTDLGFNVYVADGCGETFLDYLGDLAHRLDAEGEAG